MKLRLLWVEGQALGEWGEQIALMEFIPIITAAKPGQASDNLLLVKMIHPVFTTSYIFFWYVGQSEEA